MLSLDFNQIPKIKLNDEMIPSDHLINHLWLCSYLYPTVAACHKLGFYEALSRSTLTTDQLSTILKINYRSGRILTSLLESVGIVHRNEDRLSFSEFGKVYISPKSPFSWIGMFQREFNNPICKQIVLSAKSSMLKEAKLEHLLTPDWENNNLSQQQAYSLTHSMHSENSASAKIQANSIDLTSIDKLLDVGGGSGVFSLAFAEANPNLKCTVADLPQVIAEAKHYINKSNAASRIQTFSFNFFSDAWPSPFGAILLSNILHDWPKEKMQRIIKSAYKSLEPEGLLIINELIDEEVSSRTSFAAAAFSVVMLIRTSGYQLKFGELSDLLVDEGFETIRRIESPSIFSLITARKIGRDNGSRR